MTTAKQVTISIAILIIGSFSLSPVFAQDSSTTTTTPSGNEEQVNANTTNQGAKPTTTQPVNNPTAARKSGAATNGQVMTKPKLPDSPTANAKARIAQENAMKTGDKASREAKMETERPKIDIKMATKEANLMLEKQGLEMRIASREAKIDDLRMKFVGRQAELQQKMATREAALKKKLDAFKDQQKATIAAQVSTNLNTVNKNRTDAMNKNLGILTNVLIKLQNIASESAAKGKDITAAQIAIDTAGTAITEAQRVVNIQAGNDYTLVITQEAQVRVDAQSKRSQLEKDLQSAHQYMLSAKQALVDAVNAIKSIPGGVTNTNGQ